MTIPETTFIPKNILSFRSNDYYQTTTILTNKLSIRSIDYSRNYEYTH